MWGEAQRGPGFQPLFRPGFPILPATDCVVLASSPEAAETSPLLQLRVQGKEKHQTLEVSLPPVSGGASWPRPLPCALQSPFSGWRMESLPSVVLGPCPS